MKSNKDKGGTSPGEEERSNRRIVGLMKGRWGEKEEKREDRKDGGEK